MAYIPIILVQDSIQHILPLAAGEEPRQTYTPIVAGSDRTMASGREVRQTRWRKWSTTISASGWQPDAWLGIDWTRPLDLWCVEALAMDGTGLEFTLPAARRPDVAPVGLALVGRDLRRTSLTLTGNVATLTAVAGAIRYRVLYYPVLTVHADEPTRSSSPHEGRYEWEINAREVNPQ